VQRHALFYSLFGIGQRGRRSGLGLAQAGQSEQGEGGSVVSQVHTGKMLMLAATGNQANKRASISSHSPGFHIFFLACNFLFAEPYRAIAHLDVDAARAPRRHPAAVHAQHVGHALRALA
jgi:hypothetical protein